LKKFITLFILLNSLWINAQTPITDSNIEDAIDTCLSTNPVDGMCSDSEYGAMPYWDVSSIGSMSALFYQRTEFNADISSWDASNVENMEKMFYGAKSFNQDISSWDVSNVISMSQIFQRAESFNQPLNNWDVSNVINMGQMFTEAQSFNQDISSWDVSGQISMRNMFAVAKAFNQDINSWDMSNVTDMFGMFYGAESFNQPLNNWDVSNVIAMGQMFDGAESFNQDISDWCVINIDSEPNYFSSNSSLSESNKPVWGTCPALGVDDQYLITIAIYPNPTDNTLFITGNETPIAMTIYNVLGKEVLSINNTNSINVEALPSGVYVIRISDSVRQTNRKFIKN
jgi:surface protein